MPCADAEVPFDTAVMAMVLPDPVVVIFPALNAAPPSVVIEFVATMFPAVVKSPPRRTPLPSLAPPAQLRNVTVPVVPVLH